MANERTLAIIKPDAMLKGIIGDIVQRMEEHNLKVVGGKLLHLSRDRAEGFYAVHKGKPFFGDLCSFMSSGPCFVLCLEGEGAIKKWRDVMGPTDPEGAAEGTIRGDFGTDIQANAVHGSDASDTAKFEIGYFFEPHELVQYEWV
ncbi:MAG: nucleoside-diphosphate kinase [Deltaproteobacteria bacterium]|nr:nucleoside-diphosphate kinase [Deltaproteobacteria bacterium]